MTFRHSQTNDLPIDATPSYQWSSDLSEWNESGTANADGTIATIVATIVTDNEAPANDEVGRNPSASSR